MKQALALDARQRAMLEEMGIKLIGWPSAPGAVPVAAAAVAPESAPVAPPVPAVRPAAAALGAAVLAGPARLVCGSPDAPAGGWLIVADMPPGLDGRHGEPFEGDAGQLLLNMLRALQLPGGRVPVRLMRIHRGVASGQPGSPGPIGEACAGAVVALAPQVVLAMGPLAAQSLLHSSEPLGKLRGRVMALATQPALPLVATYHPAYLLRNPADKGRAWNDLCLAADLLGPGG
ncbi:MAG TPA: uracil-DNA glycosylase family protein [Variovorax sp.]